MKILIDVGNTNTKVSIYKNDLLLKKIIFNTIKNEIFDEYHKTFKTIKIISLKNVIISGVVPLVTNQLIKYFFKYHDNVPIVVNSNMISDLKIVTDAPDQIGSDILSAAVGALKYKKNSLIIDLGTANKIIYLKDGSLMGAKIAPGIKTTLNSLVENTSLLAKIILKKTINILGVDTVSCMQSGIIYGTAAMIDGLIKRIKKKLIIMIFL